MISELEVQVLVKQFDTNCVVNRVSFHVRDGEFFVLLGPSGGGKTTILRMISGLEHPDEGRVMLNRNDVTEWQPRQRNVGMVFQEYALYPNMTVYGNIAYGLEVRHVARKEIKRRVVEAADMLGIAPLLQRSPVQLSGGEQQRVALARALVKDADVFLFDEPLASLDAKLRYQIRRDILHLHRMKQKPTIYVTHDQIEAFSMADRIGVVANGSLQQVGTPDELLESPANLFIARFLGTPPMNLIRGALRSDTPGYNVRAEGFDLTLPTRWNRALRYYDESQLVVGIRPNAIIPEWQFPQREIKPDLLLHAQVYEIEPLVGESIVTLRLTDGSKLTALFEDAGDFSPRIGETISIGIDTEYLCLFHPTTEQRLKMNPI